MKPKKMADSMVESILSYLANNNGCNTLDLAKHFNEDHQKIVGAVKSIQASGDIIHCEQVSTKEWALTDEGEQVVLKGSHEAVIYNAIPVEGIRQDELMKQIPNANIGFGKALSLGWIQVDKSGQTGPRVLKKVDAIDDFVQQNLLKIRNKNTDDVADNIKQDYKKRKLLQEVLIKSFDITKGINFSVSVEKSETDLTPEMIASGSWKEKKFKAYNFDAMGVPPMRGHLHPLMRVRAQFRQIFLEMGFSEMPTNNFIESSFWNFDALFVPQKHPARDVQDTFYVSEPKFATDFPYDYLERVRKVHQDGDYNSKGYGYEWKLEETKKNTLRTHTTAVSARMLHKLAQEKTFRPAKYFSIDRVFRNETLDATHLAEFFQIEGVVADYNVTLGDLIGVLYEFFRKLGMTKLRFKPAYNPYTEPSMEIFSYHEGLEKWVEVGNSGMFRPEMLLPMGLPPGVSVAAWGLSLERPTMIKYKIDNIRDLAGHKINLKMVSEAPISRIDKPQGISTKLLLNPLELLEARQERVLGQLQEIKSALQNFIHQMRVEALPPPLESPKDYQRTDVLEAKDVVITTSANDLPLSVFALCKQLGQQRVIHMRSHCHSSLRDKIPSEFSKLLNGSNVLEMSPPSQKGTLGVLKITLIFSDDVREPEMIVEPNRRISGEVNMARYLARHLDPPYDSDPVSSTSVDQWLDVVHDCVLSSSATNRDRKIILNRLSDRLASNDWLTGKGFTLADVVLWAAIQRHFAGANLAAPIKKWVANCSVLDVFDLAKKFLPST